jgi:hypothetical protein
MNGKKLAGRRASRQAAHTMTSKESKVRSRWSTGGYTSPGSFKKDYPHGRKKSHK